MEEEKEVSPEQEPTVYYLAARFNTREEAAVPYYAVQETLRTTDCDLSSYRFMQQWDDISDKPWYVIVIGEKPTDTVHQRLITALNLGDMTNVPQEAIEGFLIRRATEVVKGPWVEGHYKEGLQFTQIKFSRKQKSKRHQRRRH